MKKNYFNLIAVLIVALAFTQNARANDNYFLFTSSVTTTDYYTPGTTMDIQFELDYFSVDWDYGDYISLTFPAGITPVASPTDPFAPVNEGQGGEYLNPIVGQQISWGTNNNDQWGGIENGVHSFIVTVSIDPDITGDQIVNIVVSGAEYGTPQADLNITCTLQEFPTGPDLSVAAVKFDYTNYPLSQSPNLMIAGNVTNYGSDLTTETDLVVTCDLASYSEAGAISIPLLNGATQLVELPSLTPYAEGAHTIVYSVNATDDPYESNNSQSITIGIDSVYAHDDGELVFSYGSPSFAFSMGSAFDIVADDNLTAVQFYLSNSSTIGDEFHLSVRPVELFNQTPTFNWGNPVWESDNLYVSGEMRGTWTTISTEMAVLLEEGKYGLFIHEHSAGSLELGYDGNNTGDILMSVNGDNFYWQNESYGWAMLRLVFSQGTVTSINETAKNDDISIFPNPTTGIINIENANNQNVIVYNMFGQKIIEINNASGMETIDISKQAAGTYFISSGTKTEKINLIK